MGGFLGDAVSRFFEIGFVDDVVGAVFGFEIGFGEIFADDAEEEELDATHKHDDTDEAGPAGGGVAEGECFDDDDEDDDESDEAEEETEEGGESEGDGGEGDDAFDGVFEEFPEGPFGFAGDAFNIFVFDPFGFEADEAPEAFGIAVVFAARDDGVDHRAGHEAVIAGAVDHFDFAHAVDEFVEDASAEAADGGLALAGDAAGGGAGVFLGGGVFRVDVAEQLGEEAGGILAVGIHGGDEIAGGGFEAGEQGGFFAEITREREVAHARVVFGEGFHEVESAVAAAVVDEDKLELIIGESVDDFLGFLIEERERFGFVVTWNDNTDGFHTLIIPYLRSRNDGVL